MSVQMILGDWPFSVSTAEYDELQELIEYRWAQRDRLNRKPGLQFQGPGLEERVLNGTIHVEDDEQLAYPEQMKAVAAQGEPLNLLSSHDTVTADYLGQWVIVRLEFTKKDLLGNGKAETILFTMTIKEYGDDVL